MCQAACDEMSGAVTRLAGAAFAAAAAVQRQVLQACCLSPCEPPPAEATQVDAAAADADAAARGVAPDQQRAQQQEEHERGRLDKHTRAAHLLALMWRACADLAARVERCFSGTQVG